MVHNQQIVEDAVNRLRGADGLLMPHGFLTDLPYTDLFTDTWVIIAADDNPAIGDAVTLEDIARQPWVFTYQSRSAFTSATRQIQQLGIEPRVEAVVESFLALPMFIAGTDRLGARAGGSRRVRAQHGRGPRVRAAVRRDADPQRDVVASGAPTRPRARVAAHARRRGRERA